MTSKTLERIVHFRMMPAGLVGYQADIKADEFRAERTIQFSGPHEVIHNVGKYCSLPYSFSHAVFDYNARSIVWLSKGKPEEGSDMSYVWHIGDHYNLESVEQAYISISQKPVGRPTILPDGELTSIMATRLIEEPHTKSQWQIIGLAQKGPEHKWQVVGMPPQGDLRQESELFLGTSNDSTNADAIGLGYVLSIRVTGEGGIFIDEMRFSPFKNLRTEKDALWRSFEIQCRYNYLNSEQRAWFMTTNYNITEAGKDAGKGHPHRLYMCKIEAGNNENDHCTINVEWITLWADGSINSTDSAVKPQSHEPFVCAMDGIPKALRVLGLADNKTFVVLWQACYFKSSPDGYSTLIGLTFEVGDDGAVPSPADWHEISIKNTCGFFKPGDAMTTAVLVPEDFGLA